MSTTTIADFAAIDPTIRALALQVALVEIDPRVFMQQRQSVMPAARRRAAVIPEDVTWQYNGRVFRIGFRMICRQCQKEGNRAEFNKGEHPPWTCPNPECGSIDVISTKTPERKQLPEVIVDHAVRTTMVFPPKIDPQGRELIEKDQSQPQIPILVKLAAGQHGEELRYVPRRFRSQFDGMEFDTAEQLLEHERQTHLEEFVDSGRLAPTRHGADVRDEQVVVTERRPMPQPQAPPSPKEDRRAKLKEAVASAQSK